MATRKPKKTKSSRKSPVGARPIAPKMVTSLQEQLTAMTASVSQLNGALRYEQKRIAAQRRAEFYASVGRGVKDAAVATGQTVVAVNKAMGGAIVSAGKRAVESATWLFTKKVEAEAETAKA